MQPVYLPHLTLLDYAVLFWLALGFISLLWTERRAPAITELRVLMVEPILFYLIIRTMQLKHRSLLSLIDALLAAGFTVAFIGLFQFIQGQAVITAEEGVRRLASVYGSPNNVGLFLGRCIPFVLAFAVSMTDRPRRLLALGALLTMIAAVILSQSAGALFLGVPAALFTVLMLVWGRRGRLILLILVVVIALAFVLSLQSARFARVLDFDSGTNFFRIRVWQSALNMIADHPLTGLGLDQFLYAFRGHYILPDAWQEPNLSHPHNFVLDFWVRLGIMGVIAFIIMQIGFWRQVLWFYRNTRRGQTLEYALMIGAVGCMINLLAHGLVDNSVYVQDLVYVFVLMLALAVRLQNGRAIDEPL
jgi:O-antigen ligase